MRWVNETMLAVAIAALVVALPLRAQDGLSMNHTGVEIKYSGGDAMAVLWADRVAVTYKADVAVMTPTYVGVGKHDLETLITRNGITFPDLSEQRSAAYSKSEMDTLLASLAPAVAWPMVCKTDVENGFLPDHAQYGTLFCRSPQSDVPGGHIGSGAGVPDGYYFLVTDVLANCRTTSTGSCHERFFRLTRRNISDNSTDVETWVFPLTSTETGGDLATAEIQAAGPLMILEQGDYLIGLANYTDSVSAQVMGYLTANPERFKP